MSLLISLCELNIVFISAHTNTDDLCTSDFQPPFKIYLTSSDTEDKCTWNAVRQHFIEKQYLQVAS